ncbi:MAG: acetylglutamate kinase [Paramuribaculum sp.]|nr:acetylglutamate kinase [Paramuribaculum sp.]
MITVVKIGGNVVDNPEALSRFVNDFATLEGPKILVHGGGKEATRLSARLDIPTTMIEGRRVTTRETLDVVTMVYAGLINKRIVSALQSRGCNAIGLSGADGNIIPAKKRPAAPIDYGFVGDIDAAKINTTFLATLLDSGMVPVFCAIMHDGNGSLLNCNADSVASAVAVAASTIAPTRLIFCFEKDGVLSDVDNPDSLIEAVTRSSYTTLKQDGVVNKGMIPKIDNAFAAISQGVSSVTIKHSDNLLKERGTTITE